MIFRKKRINLDGVVSSPHIYMSENRSENESGVRIGKS